MQPEGESVAGGALWAGIGIGVQMLALVRILAEYLRLRRTSSGGGERAVLDHYVVGALIAAVLASVSMGLFFFERYVAATVVSAFTVVALLVYKFTVMR